MLRASRGRGCFGATPGRADERGVRLPSNSCLPHEIGAAPPTHPYSARLPPGPPLRCCGPNYPGGQDGKWWGMQPCSCTQQTHNKTQAWGGHGPYGRPQLIPPPWGEASRRALCAGCSVYLSSIVVSRTLHGYIRLNTIDRASQVSSAVYQVLLQCLSPVLLTCVSGASQVLPRCCRVRLSNHRLEPGRPDPISHAVVTAPQPHRCSKAA